MKLDPDKAVSEKAYFFVKAMIDQKSALMAMSSEELDELERSVEYFNAHIEEGSYKRTPIDTAILSGALDAIAAARSSL